MIMGNGKFWGCDSHFSISHFHFPFPLKTVERDKSYPYNSCHQRRNEMNHAPPTADMQGSLESGVLTLFEFFSGPSYFSSRLRKVRFSARKLTFSVCIASMTSRIDTISEVNLLNTCDMSVTCSFISIRI